MIQCIIPLTPQSNPCQNSAREQLTQPSRGPRPYLRNTPILERIPSRSLAAEPRSDRDLCGLKKQGLLMDPEEFMHEHSLQGKLYHATTAPKIQDIFRNGFYYSGDGYGGDAQGAGLYTSNNPETYEEVFGIAIPLNFSTYSKHLRILVCRTTPKTPADSLGGPECPKLSEKLSPEFQSKYALKSDPPYKGETFDWTRLAKDCDVDIVYNGFPLIQNAGAFELPHYEDFLNQKVRPMLAKIHRFGENSSDDEIKNFTSLVRHLEQLLQADTGVDHSEAAKVSLDNLLEFYNPKNVRLYRARTAQETFQSTSECKKFTAALMNQKTNALTVQDSTHGSHVQPDPEEELKLAKQAEEYMKCQNEYLDKYDPFQFRKIPIVTIAALREAFLKTFEHMLEPHKKIDSDRFLAVLKLLYEYARFASYPPQNALGQNAPGKMQARALQFISLKKEALTMVQKAISFITPELLAELKKNYGSEISNELSAIERILAVRK